MEDPTRDDPGRAAEGSAGGRPSEESGGRPEATGPGAIERSAAGGRAVSPTELERVIRRASDLQFRSGSDEAGSALDEGEVVRIGEEVGLEPRYVRQALAEVHADSLIPALPDDSDLPARLWGTALVRAIRVVPGDPASVEADLDGYLRDREVLTRVRSQPGRSLYEPAGGLLSTMRRAMNVSGHGYELAKAKSLEARIERLEPGFSLVTLTADLRNERTSIAAGWHAGLGIGAVPVALAILASAGLGILPILGAGAIGGAAVGGATAATGAQFARRRERLELVLQGLLDRLEQGERLTSSRSSWKDRLLDAAR